MSTTRQPLAKLEMGIHDQFWRKLHKHGVTAEDVDSSHNDENVMDEVASVLMTRHLLSSPERQVELLNVYNERAWKDNSITDRAIRNAGDPPLCPTVTRKGLFCPVLLRETGDPIRTFYDNIAALRSYHGKESVKDSKINGVIRVGDMAKRRAKGIRWAIVELGRTFPGIVAAVLGRLTQMHKMAVGQELPLISAMHPSWAFAKKSDLLPGLIAPDLEIEGTGRGDESFVPYLTTDASFDEVFFDRIPAIGQVNGLGVGWFYQ